MIFLGQIREIAFCLSPLSIPSPQANTAYPGVQHLWLSLASCHLLLRVGTAAFLQCTIGVIVKCVECLSYPYFQLHNHQGRFVSSLLLALYLQLLFPLSYHRIQMILPDIIIPLTKRWNSVYHLINLPLLLNLLFHASLK